MRARSLTLTVVAAALLALAGTAGAQPPPWAHAAPKKTTTTLAPTTTVAPTTTLAPTTTAGPTTTVAPTTTTVGLPGNVIVNPTYDCAINPETQAAETPIGKVVETSDQTIVNPIVRNCQTGIMVRPLNGVVPQRIKIIAHAGYPGYSSTIFLHNRAAIRVKRGIDVEIGDVSAPADQVGGALRFENNYKHLEVNGDQRTRVHHVTSCCQGTGSIYAPQTSNRGAIWGFKWLADRTFGQPQESRDSRIDHSVVAGYFEEGISTDSRGNTPALRSGAAFGTVTGKGTNTLTLSGIGTTENYVGQFIIVNEGPAQGASFQITARTSNTFTVLDPDAQLSGVAVNNRVTLGMRFSRFRADHNQVATDGVKNGINFHGSTLYSRIDLNTMTGTPTFIYGAPFHNRAVPQCLKIHSMAGPDVPMFAFFNSIVGNLCDGADTTPDTGGDISATVISWGTYEVDSPTWMAGNTWSGSPLGQEVRYKTPQPATDPTIDLAGGG